MAISFAGETVTINDASRPIELPNVIAENLYPTNVENQQSKSGYFGSPASNPRFCSQIPDPLEAAI